MLSSQEKKAFDLAILEAEKHLGTTMPNPTVGAAALNSQGEVLGVAATEPAGKRHAERKLIEELKAQGKAQEIHTLLVTLEPCNHTGRTPPCTDIILKTPVKRLIYGAVDPNQKVVGNGAEFLKTNGLEVLKLDEADLANRCESLIRAFRKHISTGLPYVLIKTAHRADGSMIPPPGAKTFTSLDSLKAAHRLRANSDAIMTGVGTVLADLPEFTVRLVDDLRSFPRWIVVMDRNSKTPKAWIESREKAGFKVKTFPKFKDALVFLGNEGCLQVLVEAGPTLVQALQTEQLWDEHVKFEVVDSTKTERVTRVLRK